VVKEGAWGRYETYVSTEKAPPCQAAWIHGPDEYAGRAAGAESSSRAGPQAAGAVVALAGLRGQDSFKRVATRGRRVSSDGLALTWLYSGNEASRYGIAARVAVGKAVVRNRVRRWARELLRRWDAQLAPGYDVVITARSNEAAVNFQHFAHHLARMLHKAELAEELLDVPA
jgi:ribonuclease P protein component